MSIPESVHDIITQAYMSKHKGDIKGACALYEQAAEKEPESPAVIFGLGELLLDAGNVVAAQEKFEKVRALGLETAKTYTKLGICAVERGDDRKAIPLFKKATELNSTHFPAFVRLAAALSNVHAFPEVESVCKKGMEIRQDLHRIYWIYANALKMNGKLDEAIDVLESLMERDSTKSKTRANLAALYIEKGDIAKAENQLEKALLDAPEAVPFHSMMAYIKDYKSADDPQILKMKLLLNKPHLLEENKVRLLFALGKAHESAGSYKEAFAFYQKANGFVNKNAKPYSLSGTAQMFAAIKETSVQSISNDGALPFTPVFVVGMPRAGLNVTGKFLTKNDKTVTSGEQNILGQILNEGDFLKFSDDDLKRVRSLYIEKAGNISGVGDADFFVDQSPMNFLYLGLIKALFPQAKIIHCVRDARDVALSIYKYDYGLAYDFSYDQNNIAHYYGLYHDLMKHWHEVLSEDIFDASFEKLIDKDDAMLRDLSAYFGLSPGAAENHPLSDSRSAGRWKCYEDFLHPAIKNLKNLSAAS